MTEYETDIVLWSEHQAALLRRRAAGEFVNEAELDWANIAEEIESVGNEQRHAVESLLRALIHMLKAEAWPQSPNVPHWQAEMRVFLSQARRRFVPFMRQRLNLPGIYADAVRGLPSTMDGVPPQPVPHAWPLSLDELLSNNLV